MKLGLMGVTVVFASGDTGVAGIRGRCIAAGGGWTPPGASYGGFSPCKPSHGAKSINHEADLSGNI
jgi:tripeptidyl-peptidase I